jgi:pilus assembly protein FimV
MLIYLLQKITRGRAVRIFPYKTWLWVGVFLLFPWVAHAAGLGKLNVLSALGQPLSAEIDLVSVQKDEFSTLSARIASPEAFQQANIQYSQALIGTRLSIERRADGSPFIKIISTRPINEPFVSVLIELSWAQGRLLREYTALLDPAGYASTPQVTAPVAATPMAAPPAAPEITPLTPVPQADVPASAVSPAGKATSPPSTGPVKAASSEYTVKRGDTLAKIAANIKPEGVTLNQMLVSLYRNNADAFVGNMNRLKAGKILRMPEKERVAETAPAEATKEVRVQASDWNAYRLKLAEAAGAAPAPTASKSAASGKITTAVEDKAAGKDAPKEVLKLSKSDTGTAGKAGSGKEAASGKDRLRMLEEEAIAREKTLAEANARVAQLEKNIKDMQRLLEIKGAVPPAAKPGATVPPAPPAKAEPPKSEPAKMEPAKDAAKVPDAPKGDQKAPPPVVEPPKAEAPKGDAPKADTPKVDAEKKESAPQPKPKVVAPPPPPPEPSLVDQIISAATDPMYLGGGLLVVVLIGGVAFWFVRRRRAQDSGDDFKEKKSAPKLALAKATGPVAATVASPAAGAAAASDDVDPLAEADLYLNFGRDAQAEEVLKEALGKNPQHEEAQLKLLQIYAARKDKAEFEKIARNLNTQTSGAGENWLKAAGMGFAFDPENSLYAAGKSAPAAAMPQKGGAAGPDLDFDLELSAGASAATATDFPLDDGGEKTTMMRPGELAGMSEESVIHDVTADSARSKAAAAAGEAPDFSLNIPAKSNAAADPASPMVSAIDFNFDATAALGTPAQRAPAPDPQEFKHDSTVVISPENQNLAAGLDMDFDIGGAAPAAPAGTGSVIALAPEFKLDFGGDAASAAPAMAIPDIKLDDISLNLDDVPKTAAAPEGGGTKDDRWYDVQTKFDLAKAYQEMGDKDGAREILREVIKEGDATQQSEAKQLLDTLG